MVARLEGGWVFDLGAVNEGAVCAVEVSDLKVVAVGCDAGVVAGDLGRGDNDGVVFVISYCNTSDFSVNVDERGLDAAPNPLGRPVILKHR